MIKYYLTYAIKTDTFGIITYDDEKPNRYTIRSLSSYKSLKAYSEVTDNIQDLLRYYKTLEIGKETYDELSNKMNEIQHTYERLKNCLNQLNKTSETLEINSQDELYLVSGNKFMKLLKPDNYNDTDACICETNNVSDDFDYIYYYKCVFFYLYSLNSFSIIRKQDFVKLKNLFSIFKSQMQKINDTFRGLR